MLKVTRPRFRPRFPDRSFAPGLLFGSGIQGVWYDPSDFSTMFQDVAGTTPVTAVEQLVALIRDKSGNGNAATQSVSGSRPILRARYNLITFSEQFDNPIWLSTNVSVTPNTVLAPDGTLTADSANFTSTIPPASAVRLYQDATVNSSNGVSYTGSVWMRADTNRTISLSIQRAGPADTQNTFCNVTSTWQRFTITHTGVWTGSSAVRLNINNPSQTGVIYVWGAQLILTSDIAATGNAYQRITTSTSYDTSNPAFRSYLAFDGSDDSILTGNIDFSATDKMTVCAGITKTSDAAQSVVAELSATIASNNGSFLVSAPNSAAANYNFSSKGTTQVDNTVTTYTAPNTAVLTGQANIGAPSNIIRVNGAQAGSVATTQGIGNFGNYPLYIGRRNNATLPFSGRLYGLIVRGAASTPSQIAGTESWMNGKTGAY